jgi:predicted kinase
MLQMLSLDVADTCCWVSQTLFFNAADVVFRCYRHVVLDVVLRRREKRHLMLDVARNTGGNMAAI